MAAVMAGAAIVGAGAQAYGQIKGAQSQADIERQKAALDEAQATEVLSREAANEEVRAQTLAEQELGAASESAGLGHASTGVGSQLEMKRQMDITNLFAQREANFQASMLRAGAGLQLQEAQDTESAGYIKAAGSILGAAGSIGQIYRPNTAAKESLPAPGGAVAPALGGMADSLPARSGW